MYRLVRFRVAIFNQDAGVASMSMTRRLALRFWAPTPRQTATLVPMLPEVARAATEEVKYWPPN